MAFQEQERLLTELIGPRETPAAERPKACPAAAQKRAAERADDGVVARCQTEWSIADRR